jgi:BASS family bile acid:Na+ symporter
MKKSYKILLLAALVCLLISLGLLLSGLGEKMGPPLVFFFILLALAVRGHDSFKGFSFTILIFAAVTISMFYPSYFVSIYNFQLKLLIVPLLHKKMFGMGVNR